MIAIEPRICHSGGFTTAIRIIIKVGAKNGTIDSATDAMAIALGRTR